jgi:hypothetical protein
MTSGVVGVACDVGIGVVERVATHDVDPSRTPSVRVVGVVAVRTGTHAVAVAVADTEAPTWPRVSPHSFLHRGRRLSAARSTRSNTPAVPAQTGEEKARAGLGVVLASVVEPQRMRTRGASSPRWSG